MHIFSFFIFFIILEGDVLSVRLRYGCVLLFFVCGLCVCVFPLDCGLWVYSLVCHDFSMNSSRASVLSFSLVSFPVHGNLCHQLCYVEVLDEEALKRSCCMKVKAESYVKLIFYLKTQQSRNMRSGSREPDQSLTKARGGDIWEITGNHFEGHL